MSAQPAPDAAAVPVRVAIPQQLRTLAGVASSEVVVQAATPLTVRSCLDALETTHPTLVGTVRDRGTGRRRPMIRIYADGEDLSDEPPDTPLPARVTDGAEPLRLVGAIAGG